MYARNVCFDIATFLGYDWFIQLDDDYYWFGYRTDKGGKSIKNLDIIFDYLIEFMQSDNRILSVALSQGGDHIGGYKPNKKITRKAMNSFICSTSRPFKFFGRMNEDVNTYTRLGHLGNLFFTICNLQLDQKDTQSNDGGMTSIYNTNGTYVKSFYTILYGPSYTKIGTIGIKHPRLHHRINWNCAVPCILSSMNKKH